MSRKRVRSVRNNQRLNLNRTALAPPIPPKVTEVSIRDYPLIHLTNETVEKLFPSLISSVLLSSTIRTSRSARISSKGTRKSYMKAKTCGLCF